MMNTTLVIGVLSFIGIFLILRMPKLLLRFVGTSTVRVVIGILLLLFLNVIGNQFGLYVPINIFTVLVSSILGVFGVISLASIHMFILS